MEGIPIYYVMQPSTDDSLNVFFLPPHIKSQADVKIKDVVTNFPHRDSGRFFHFRFYAICDKDQKTWVDISNMSAKAPVVENRILLKVLEIEKPHYSKLFAAVSKASREEPNPQPESRSQQREQPMNTSGQRPAQNQSRPAEERPRPPTNVTSPPKTQTSQPQSQPQPNVKSPPPSSAHDYEDLLGGDHGPTSYTQTTTTTTTKVTFSSPQQEAKFDDDSAITKGMTREELTAYKEEKKNKAIQAQLAFANKIWADENKNKEEKEKAYEELEDNIKKWAGKNGQRNNIRALLCTVHEVMWPGCDWQPLSLSDLMMPNKIKVNYFKAITKFHPDKNQGAEYRQRYIAERVTNELNAAWDEFRKTNP